MFFHGNYDCEVVLSSDENCESVESDLESEDESKQRRFILGDNLLAYNGLEVIRVKMLKEENSDKKEIEGNKTTKKIYEIIKTKNLSNKEKISAYDEIVSDLEDEEVSESEEESNKNQESINDIDNCHEIRRYEAEELRVSCIDYELPTVGRYQSEIINTNRNIGKTSIEEISQYCLQERQRRMKDNGDSESLQTSDLCSSDDRQLLKVSQSDSSLSMKECAIHVSNNTTQTVLPKETLSNLSIDLLTEYINSNKPLKEIINKSKKQFSCHLKKPKKSKTRNNKKSINLETENIKKAKSELIVHFSLNSVPENPIHNENVDICEIDYDQQSQMQAECDVGRYIRPCDKDLRNADLSILSTISKLRSKDHLTVLENSLINLEDKSSISHTSDIILYPSISLLHCTSNNDDQYLSFLNSTLKFKDQSIEPIVSYSSNDSQSIPSIKYEEDIDDQTLPSDKSYLGEDKELEISERYTKYAKVISPSTLDSGLIVDDSFHQHNHSDSTTINTSMSMFNSYLKDDDHSLSSQNTDSNGSHKSVPCKCNSAAILPKSFHSNDVNHSESLTNSEGSVDNQRILSEQSDLNKDEDSTSQNYDINTNDKSTSSLSCSLEVDYKHILLNDSESHSIARYTSSVNSNLKNGDQSLSSDKSDIVEDHQSSSLQNFDSNILNESISTFKSELNIPDEYISKPKSDQQTQLSQKCKTIPDKFDETSMPTEVKELIKKSFNRISHYNFLSNDDALQIHHGSVPITKIVEKKSKDSMESLKNISLNLKIKVSHNLVNDDNDSKDSTTSSIDSGFQESKEDVFIKEIMNVTPKASLIVDKDYSMMSSNNSSCASETERSRNTVATDCHLLTATKIKGSKRKDQRLNNDVDLHIANNVNNIINPFKKVYHSFNSLVQTEEEISEFLNYQWFKFCEMHTLYNLS